MHHLTRIDLRRLILTLATVSVILTLVNALYATYKVQKDLLIDGTLTANQAYATKLARSTAMHLKLVLSELKWSSRTIAQAPHNLALSQLETERLLHQSDSFSAVMRVNAKGQLQTLAAPESAHLFTSIKGNILSWFRSRLSIKPASMTALSPGSSIYTTTVFCTTC